MRHRLDAVRLFGRVGRIAVSIHSRPTPLDVCSSPKSTKTGLTTNGRTFYSVMRLIHLSWCSMGIYRFQRPKDAAYRSRRTWSQDQSNFAPKIGIWACFSSQGVGALRIFDDQHGHHDCTPDTMQQFMKPCALRFWPSGNLVVPLVTTPPISKSHRSLAWFHINGVQFGRALAPLT